MDQAVNLAENIAKRYGVWIVLGLMALEITLEYRRSQKRTLLG
jgi:hypothetical protein